MKRAPSSFGFALVAVSATVVVALGVAFYAWIAASRSAVLERQAANDARTVAQIALSFGETLRALEVALLAIADDIRDAPNFEVSPEAQLRGARLLKTIPGLFSALVVDRDARLRHSFLVDASPNIPFRDRTYFAVHADGPDARFFIGPSIVSFTYGGRLIPTSLGVRNADGAFAGVVTGTMRYESALNTLRSLIGDDQALYVFTRTGELVISTDQTAASGDGARGVWPDTSGWLVEEFAPDGQMTMQPIDLVDLVVVLKTGRAAVLGNWRRDIAFAAAVFAVLTLVVAGTAATLARAMRAQRRLANALADANAQKTKMFSVIAHDLRGPFGALAGFASMLAARAETASREDLAEYAAHIEATSLALGHTCDSVLMWGRAQLGGLHLVSESVDAFEALTTAARGLDMIAEGKEVAVAIDQPPAPLHARADPRALQIVLRNVVDNAVKFSRRGGDVRLRAEADGDGVRFVVADDGVGFSHAQLDAVAGGRVVDETVGAGGERGTGLGLSLSRELVTAMDGVIDIASAEGEGSIVSIRLPAR